MWPPTHSIAAVPITVITVSSRGIALTSPRPNLATALPGALGQRQPGVVHLHDEPDDAVHQHGDADRDDRQDDRPGHERLVDHLVQRDDHDLGRQDEVGADGPGRRCLLVRQRVLGRGVVVVVPLTLRQTFSAPS